MTEPKYKLETPIFVPEQAHPDDAHSVLMRLVPPGSRVLELGCSSGYLSGYMRQSLGCYVVGAEADPNATALAAAHTDEVYTLDLDDTDATLAAVQGNAPYDVLLAPAVLEHLRYPEPLLRALRPLLTDEATVIVSLPNIAHWQFRWRLLRGVFDYEDYGVMDRTHTRLYTLKTGRELLEANGYSVTEVHIAGSGVQNTLNALTGRRFRWPLVLPGLLAYELIYVAKKQAGGI